MLKLLFLVNYSVYNQGYPPTCNKAGENRLALVWAATDSEAEEIVKDKYTISEIDCGIGCSTRVVVNEITQALGTP